MAPHSSTLAWQIPWTEEPGRLQSMGSLGVRHDWATSLSLFTFMHWRRKWQPTPVFFPGESQGQGSLVDWQSMGSHRVGHDWSDLAAAAASLCVRHMDWHFGNEGSVAALGLRKAVESIKWNQYFISHFSTAISWESLHYVSLEI